MSTTTRTHRIVRAGLVGTAALALSGLAVAGPATAKDPEVRTSGSCSEGATWKLKVKGDDGGLEVEGEVDSNVVGQTWSWRILDNGVVKARGTSTTTAPSGSFSVERRIADLAGDDKVRFVATHGTQTCRGAATYGF